MILPHRRSTGHPLSRADLRAYLTALRFSRPMYVDVRILDRNENQISSLTAPDSMVVGGQVDFDVTTPVTRSIQLDVIDPRHRLFLDPSAPHKGALFPGQLLRVLRWDYVASFDDWVMCPVFWGPITRFIRKGYQVTIEGQGKESLYLDPNLLWEPLTFRKGYPVVSALHDVLYRRGERRFSLPNLSNRLPNKLSLTRHDQPWLVAQSLAKSVSRQLFIDGEGVVRLRVQPTKAILAMYAFYRSVGAEPVVLDEPEITADFFADMRNTQEVLGPQPVGKQRRIRSVRYPPNRDPLSPASLAINGSPRYIVYSEENDNIKRQSQADARARQLDVQNAKLTIDARFTCLPFPQLEENDIVALAMEDSTIQVQLQKYSIPLTPDGVMSIGHHKRMLVGSRFAKLRDRKIAAKKPAHHATHHKRRHR